ncbi:MAG: Rrf2 family transcriptional regulator [Dehalococcoidia bacterium]
MQLVSRGTDYAIRAMLHVAAAGDGGTATTQEIAENQGISQVFLSKIVQRLVRAGFLRAYRGAAGGITLSQSPSDINLRQIVEVMEGPMALNRCLVKPGECHRDRTCPIHEVWVEAQQNLLGVLESTTLDQLAVRGKELAG